MADFLKFINELTVNGKPVDEEEDDDYTTVPEDDDDKPDLDLDPTGTEPAEEDSEPVEDDDDYTIEPDDPEPATDSEDGEGTEGSDTSEEDPALDLDPEDDPTPAAEEPAGDTGEEEPTGEEPDLDLNPEDEPEPAAEDPASDTGEEEPTAEPEGDPVGDTDNDPDDTGDSNSLDMGTDDDDYTATGDEDPDASSDDLGDTGADDTSVDDASSEDDELEAKIKQTEAEIFNTLSDDEKAIKNRQLIDNFVDLKKITKVFLEKVQTVTVTEENDQILTFVEVSLLDLHNMITDYIITRYSKKSYIENFVTYQQFILTIEQLKEIVSKLKIDENPQK